MSFRFIAILPILALGLLLPYAAHADSPLARIRVLPSIVVHPARGVFMGAGLPNASAALAAARVYSSPLARVPILPSVGIRPPPAAGTGAAVSNASATSAPAALVPEDHHFLATVARFLDGLKPPVSGDPRDAAWRNPTLRDPARDRDATSFGIRSAPMSPSGGIAAGVGAGAGAAQLVDLGNVAKNLPVKVAPTMVQGGGGITLKVRW